ncbi:Thiocyanate methyltransferase 1 [Acorus calamus]|uniref:Thiocyanate methyltransferase 1 n=1 Tax=Acorus calamus TaxID=4465 RepID=A0AAV9CZQ6_ACOCL|nr:Thiocyanate methyltransferase 1 [Acorus calamus]
MGSKNVRKIQEVIHGGDGWNKCWEQGLTPWDTGRPTPVLVDLLEKGGLPKGRALVPGCGTGYDVVAIAGPERFVVGLEISERAIKRAEEDQVYSFSYLRNKRELKELNPYECNLHFWNKFFCAIEPSMRPAWASQVRDMLKPDGELITLMFPIGDREGGPPYNVTLDTYEEVLHPMGLRAISVEDNELAIRPRKGREKIARWKRPLNLSPL